LHTLRLKERAHSGATFKDATDLHQGPVIRAAQLPHFSGKSSAGIQHVAVQQHTSID